MIQRAPQNSASFRDPAGFIFSANDIVYRAVMPEYLPHLDLLVNSGLYQELTDKKLLIAHQEASADLFPSPELKPARILQPEKIPFLTYPYEWCFSQLKDAALLTLDIHTRALQKGMQLKDASAYNIQFRGTHPILIDTLSFEKYRENQPWAAYGQFCRHFLAPLALMAYRHPGTSKLLLGYLDGIPLDLASQLLPARSKFNPAILTHLHIHSRFIGKAGTQSAKSKKAPALSRKKQQALLQHLADGIRGLKLRNQNSDWNRYSDHHNYSPAARESKSEIIRNWLKRLQPAVTWDLGCNTGEYSRLAAMHSSQVISSDVDPYCVEELYRSSKTEGQNNILPFILDVFNPSPSIGWNNHERPPVTQRMHAGVLMALALVHHIRISNQTPWHMIADLFAEWGDHIIAEFVPADDSQVVEMLSGRADIFSDLNEKSFLEGFSTRFSLVESVKIQDSKRRLFLMKKRG